jgi:chaperone modulatory protein CbpM
MSDAAPRDTVLLGEEVHLDLTQLARTCGTTATFIEELMLEGVLAPQAAAAPTFSGADVLRVRRLMRLQRDFEATLPSAAVILDLLDEVERLRSELRRLGA